MRGVIRVAAAALVAAGSLDVSCFADVPRDGRDTTFLFFTGTDLWRNGAFAHGGLIWSPNGIDHRGFTFKLLLAGGVDRYVSGALGGTSVTGRHFAGAGLIGWRFKNETLVVTAFVGPGIEDHRLNRHDPGNRRRGTRAGLLAAIELWYQPRPDLMAAAHAAAGTTSDWVLRAAFGWRFVDHFFAGPEAQMSGDDDYQQFRLGVHVTGLKTGAFEWSAGAGWVTDSDDRSGAYGRLGLIARR